MNSCFEILCKKHFFLHNKLTLQKSDEISWYQIAVMEQHLLILEILFSIKQESAMKAFKRFIFCRSPIRDEEQDRATSDEKVQINQPGIPRSICFVG